MSSIEYINSVVLTASAANVTFSSIPQHYQDLIIFASCRSSNSSTFQASLVQINSDTSTNYSTTLLYDSGSSVLSTRTTNADVFTYLDIAANNATSDIFGILELNFMSYSNTNIYKTMLASTSAGNAQARSSVHLWRSNSAINSINLYPSASGLWVSGSNFTLWGVR